MDPPSFPKDFLKKPISHLLDYGIRKEIITELELFGNSGNLTIRVLYDKGQDYFDSAEVPDTKSDFKPLRKLFDEYRKQQSFPNDFLDRSIEHLSSYLGIGTITIYQLKSLQILKVRDLYNKGPEYFKSTEFVFTLSRQKSVRELFAEYRRQHATEVPALDQAASENESVPSTSGATVTEITGATTQLEEDDDLDSLTT